MIGTMASAIIGIAAVTTLADTILPAHRGYVIEQTRAVSDQVGKSVDKLTNELRVLQKQHSDLNREQLRKEMFELEIKFREEQNPVYKALIRQRMNQIEDALAQAK